MVWVRALVITGDFFMAINKRFTHLNHSGSNHSILDAESAYITGTLQVGPNVPVLGSDVNFFVSGNIGGTGSLTPGVGVFGGDLVVSGNLIVEGTYPSGGGGENYFWSPANAEIEASGSLHISQSFRALSLSASNGAEVTGSAVFVLDQGPTNGVIISGSSNNSVPAIDVVDTVNAATVFKVDLLNQSAEILNPVDPTNQYTKITPSKVEVTYINAGSEKENSVLIDANGFSTGGPEIAFYVSSSVGVGPPTPAEAEIYVFDENAALQNLKIKSNILKLDLGNELQVTGSAVFAGAGGVAVGSDTVFFVSGGAGYGATDKSVFGGNVHVSGNIQLENGTPIQARNLAGNDYYDIIQLTDGTSSGLGTDVVAFGDFTKTTGFGYVDHGNFIAFITGSNEGFFSGSYKFPDGLSGSLQSLTDGSPYLIGGTGITVTTGVNGAITIDATGGGSSQPQWYYTVNTDEIATSGSAAITGSLSVNPIGTGRGLLKFGGLDIGPITGSCQIPGNSSNAILGGNLLSASNGVFDGTWPVVVRHEIHIVAIGNNIATGADQIFAATYLVMSFINTSGVQTVEAVTELSRETSGSFAANYDVNFASNGNIEVSGSTDDVSGWIEWYGQRVKEMSLNWFTAART
jgi:hypothetical protein